MSLSDLSQLHWEHCRCGAPTCVRWWVFTGLPWPLNVAHLDAPNSTAGFNVPWFRNDEYDLPPRPGTPQNMGPPKKDTPT